MKKNLWTVHIISILLYLIVPPSAHSENTTSSNVCKNITSEKDTYILYESPVKTEQWVTKTDHGTGNITLMDYNFGIIRAEGNWVGNYNGAKIYGSYLASDTSVVIDGTSITINAYGRATNPTAPYPYNNSMFIMKIKGNVLNGQGEGDYTTEFDQDYWPTRISGDWVGIRTSGSGITAVKKPLPWIMLLLKN